MSFQTTGPFVTGLGLAHPVENGFLWHHTLGVPYLPGSSIKGMIRAWAKHWLEESADVDHMFFGRDDKHTDGPSAGALIIFDALPVKPVQLLTEVITPHVGAWRMTETPSKEPPADWISPNPIHFLSVERGAEFQFAIAPRNGISDAYLERAYTYLEDALDWIGAGAKTSSGYGRFLTPQKAEEAKENAEADARRADAQRKKEAENAAKNAPLSIGDIATHEEWGLVDIKEILPNNMAKVYSREEAAYTELPLSELKRR